jgi:hypothetical protein
MQHNLRGNDMSDLIEYFVRHYTLVLDNDQGSYLAVCEAVKEAIREVAPDMSAATYRAMPADKRRAMFAYNIGCNVLAIIEESTQEIIDAHDGTQGALLISEVLITNGYDMSDALGEYYLPESADAEDFFTGADDE